MSDELVGLIVCQRGGDPLRAGNVLGYNCQFCSAPLQVSPEGTAQIARGGTPVCNRCGLAAARRMAKSPLPGMLAFGPNAMEQLDEMKLNPEEIFRRPPGQPPSGPTTVDCPLCGRPYEMREGVTVNCPDYP